MAACAMSPTPSDAGIDIAESLFGQDLGTESSHGCTGQDADIDMDQILSGAGDDDDDDGDEAFIALQQAASFRKSSNLKGKSVKKGGGFQAMGRVFSDPGGWGGVLSRFIHAH